MPRFASLACAVLLTTAPFGAAVAHAADSTGTTVLTAPDATFVTDTAVSSNSVPTADSTVITDPNFAYDLQNDPSECINSNPRPNCGKKPQQAGDRGGSLQYLTFIIMLVGVGVIATVLIRNVVKRDRAIAARMAEQEKTAD
jgi:hypothetical protein